MKITYIGHSGFAAETEKAALIFDYYTGDIPAFDPDVPLYVFVSHRHRDHFNPDIFSLRGRPGGVTYILSRDVGSCGGVEDIIRVRHGESLDAGPLHIETLKSTDEGVAFIVTLGGKTIYHAGDLNRWVWREESREYNIRMAAKYTKQMDIIRGRHFDIAFVPLDPRQEEDREGGLLEFCAACRAEHIFPMHMWDDYSVIPAFKAAHPELASGIADITHPGQTFEI